MVDLILLFCQQYIADQVKREMKAKTKYYAFKIYHQKHHIFFSKTRMLDNAHINLPAANRQKKTAIVKKRLFYDFQKRREQKRVMQIAYKIIVM